jgi:hypothetical protein
VVSPEQRGHRLNIADHTARTFALRPAGLTTVHGKLTTDNSNSLPALGQSADERGVFGGSTAKIDNGAKSPPGTLEKRPWVKPQPRKNRRSLDAIGVKLSSSESALLLFEQSHDSPDQLGAGAGRHCLLERMERGLVEPLACNQGLGRVDRARAFGHDLAHPLP